MADQNPTPPLPTPPMGMPPQDSPMPPPPPPPPAPMPTPPPAIPQQPPQYQAGMPTQQVPMQGSPMPPPPAQSTPPPPPVPPAQPVAPKPPANFMLGALLPKELKVKIPAHTLKFDEPYFLRLLAGSISLTKDEKMRIIESVPKLKQSQVDELIRIFEEEKRKFAELSAEHVPQLEKLAKQHYEDWVDIEMQYAAQQKKTEETSQAEELRKKLGL